MIKKILKNHKVVKKIILVFILLFWEIILLAKKSPWTNLVLLLAGSMVGWLILEINWFFPNAKIKRLLPLLLLPLTIFILTSTPDIFGKAIIVFLNLRALLDNQFPNRDNEGR